MRSRIVSILTVFTVTLIILFGTKLHSQSGSWTTYARGPDGYIISNSTGNAYFPALATDTDHKPMVTWYNTASESSQICLRKQNLIIKKIKKFDGSLIIKTTPQD